MGRLSGCQRDHSEVCPPSWSRLDKSLRCQAPRGYPGQCGCGDSHGGKILERYHGVYGDVWVPGQPWTSAATTGTCMTSGAPIVVCTGRALNRNDMAAPCLSWVPTCAKQQTPKIVSIGRTSEK